MELSCAFSGHRPEKLPWGTDETDPRCRALKIMITRELEKLCRSGCRRFYCGMSRGADMYFLEALTELRETWPLTLEAVVPCAVQSEYWIREDQLRYLGALKLCDRTTVLEDTYTAGCMLRRNRFMVDHSDILMTVFDGSPGGTAATVRYARSRGLRIVSIWK